MPNHCVNHVKLSGLDGRVLEEIVTAFHDEDEKFSLLEYFRPMPEHTRNTTVGTSGHSYEDEDGWYGWSIKNWGTKWGDYETDLITNTRYNRLSHIVRR